MRTTKSLFPWFSGAPRSEKETTQLEQQTINPMEHQTQPQTKRKPQNPTQNQTPSQTTPTMKLRNTLNTMNFFQTLYNWLSGLLRSEKETPQPQTQNPMEQHQTKHRTKRKPQNPKPRIRLFSPLTNEDGSVKMPMLATLALAAFLAIGGLILAATCDFDYSDSFCHSPAPPKTIRLNCYYSGHTGHAQLCCRAANAYHCIIRFTNLIETETRGQRELRCTTGSKFDDCQNDTIFDRCMWERAKYVYSASWQIGCIPIKKMVTKRGTLSYVITGNHCPPADSTAGDATGDDPSADPSDN